MNWSPYLLGPVGMSRERLITALAIDDSLRNIAKDLEAIAVKTFPEMAVEDSLLQVMDFIAGYQFIWNELGNLHPQLQSRKYVGREPLFTDSSCKVVNNKVTPKDYLSMFKNYLERWAYHMHTGDEKRNWYEALDGCSSLIRRCYNNDHIPIGPIEVGGGPCDPFN